MICFAACVGFQAWEFLGSHDDPARARSLFKSVRAGWVKVSQHDRSNGQEKQRGNHMEVPRRFEVRVSLAVTLNLTLHDVNVL